MPLQDPAGLRERDAPKPVSSLAATHAGGYANRLLPCCLTLTVALPDKRFD